MFQWYLFVIIPVIGFVAYHSSQRVSVEVYGRQEYRYKWFPVFIVAAILIYLAANRLTTVPNFGDTTAYVGMFKGFPASLSSAVQSLFSDGKDKGFTFISILIKCIIGNRVVVYFGIISTFSLLLLTNTFRKFSNSFFITILLFIASGEYVQWNYNGIRQFIAVCMMFACLPLIEKKKFIPYLIICLLASTIHMTALIMIPMYFIIQGKIFNKWTIFFALVVIVSIFYIDQFTDVLTTFMTNSQYAEEVNQYLSTEGTNMFRVAFYCVPVVFAFFNQGRINHANNKVINIAVNMSFISAIIYLLSGFSSGLFIGRLPIYFSLYNYILWPWLIEETFNKQSSKFIYIILFAVYMVFYYYQIVITWGL